MRIQILGFLLACGIALPACAANDDNPFTLYLVRHAEKLHDGTKNPTLSAVGNQRAEKMALWFSDKNIREIWSSDYNRTRDTAKPTVTKLDLDLNIYDAGDIKALTENLLANQHSAVVVGHSNTTPELARLLCDCEIEDMGESEYDRMIVVTVKSDGTQVKTIKQR